MRRLLRLIFRPWIRNCGDCPCSTALHRVANEAVVFVRDNYRLRKTNESLRKEITALRAELACYKTSELPAQQPGLGA